MEGVGEKVNRLDEPEFVAKLAQGGQVARQGRWIARDIEDRPRAQRADIGFNSLGAGAGWIEDDLGILLALLMELR
jgi:hypothetical protein